MATKKSFLGSPYGHYGQLWAVAVVFGLVLFALTASSASHHNIVGWERRLLLAIFGWPDSLRSIFLAFTQLGSAWMILILPLAAWATRQKGLALRFFINGTMAFVLMEVAKSLVNRQRPVFLIPGLLPREAFTTGLGFPSGHTAIATVMGLILLPYLHKKHWWVIGVWIVSVGISRIYLGVHAPLDVIGGFGLGLIVAGVSYLYVSPKKIVKAD